MGGRWDWRWQGMLKYYLICPGLLCNRGRFCIHSWTKSGSRVVHIVGFPLFPDGKERFIDLFSVSPCWPARSFHLSGDRPISELAATCGEIIAASCLSVYSSWTFFSDSQGMPRILQCFAIWRPWVPICLKTFVNRKLKTFFFVFFLFAGSERWKCQQLIWSYFMIFFALHIEGPCNLKKCFSFLLAGSWLWNRQQLIWSYLMDFQYCILKGLALYFFFLFFCFISISYVV